MSWFKKALGNIKEGIGDYAENAWKDPLGFVGTMGIKTGIDTAEEGYGKFKYKNGGKTADNMLKQAQADQTAADTQAAATKLSNESSQAAARYGGGGADPFSTLTNSSVTNPNKKKSILGGF